ncbi:MAG TPA: hypothetical protein VN132_05900, partial [Bdellovibrio sp.]|nr:hypothetical protein [Bdellovibrio sp.]
MKTLMVLISLLMLLSPFAQASECTFSSKPQIIFQADHELHQVWSEEGAEVFQSNELPSSPSFLNYLSTIQSKISDLNPYSLLRKEYDDFMNT